MLITSLDDKTNILSLFIDDYTRSIVPSSNSIQIECMSLPWKSTMSRWRWWTTIKFTNGLHSMNYMHLAQSDEQQPSTTTHILLSLSSLDFSPKFGDNSNDLGGTNKDDSRNKFELTTTFSKCLNHSTPPNSKLKDEEEYFQQLISRKPKIKV